MPLTRFGKACQHYRSSIRNAVIADQSAATGFSSSLISEVERGLQSVPPGYLDKFTAWLELSSDEAMELSLLAILSPGLKRGNSKKIVSSEETLASILDRVEVNPPSTEITNEG